ncbi:MAG: CotH kinase family protein [Pseudomonadota bacterium]
MRRFSLALLVALVVGVGLVIDQKYFSGLRAVHATSGVDEAYIRKGVLGEILRNAGLLRVSDETAHLAAHRLCTSDAEMSAFDRHDQVRLKVEAFSKYPETVRLTVENGSRRPLIREWKIKPRLNHYSFPVFVDPETPLSLTFHSSGEKSVHLKSFSIDAQFGRSYDLVVDNKAVNGSVVTDSEIRTSEFSPGFTGWELNQFTPNLRYALDHGLPSHLFSGVFPGKKNRGHCRYVANMPVSVKWNSAAPTLTKVDLMVDPDDLFGPRGILDNVTERGRSWEVPADMVVDNGRIVQKQRVGIRTHGGIQGRSRGIYSIRAHARKQYGSSRLDPSLLLNSQANIDLSSIVFKYTDQANGPIAQEFIPYLHAVALDIGREVGALVPRHNMVSLYLNGEYEGMRLALEHPSPEMIENWLKHDRFAHYELKNYVHPDIYHRYSVLMARVLGEEGEATFDAATTYMYPENIINAAILSSYIADDDLCQGLEVMLDKTADRKEKWIIINWDLDHAFFVFNQGANHVSAEKYLYIDSTTESCVRSRVLFHLIKESARFRQQFIDTYRQKLADELTPENINRIIDKYEQLDADYYDGRFTENLNLLRTYASERPPIIEAFLDHLESKYKNSASG